LNDYDLIFSGGVHVEGFGPLFYDILDRFKEKYLTGKNAQCNEQAKLLLIKLKIKSSYSYYDLVNEFNLPHPGTVNTWKYVMEATLGIKATLVAEEYKANLDMLKKYYDLCKIPD
jgi:hypothetical protein